MAGLPLISHGIRQVAQARLLDAIGAVSDAFLKSLDEALAAYLGE